MPPFICGVSHSQGRVGKALHFDGVSGSLSAQDSPIWAFGSSDFTIELWANFDSAAAGDFGHPADVFIANDEGPFLRNKWLFGLYAGGLELIFLSSEGNAHLTCLDSSDQ